MTDLLTPEEAKNGLALWDNYEGTGYQVSPEWVKRLCRDYLTLWDQRNDLRYRLLEHGERIAELEGQAEVCSGPCHSPGYKRDD